MTYEEPSGSCPMSHTPKTTSDMDSWAFRDLTEEFSSRGYRSLKAECERLGIQVATAQNWIRAGKVRGGVAGRMFGSNGIFLVHAADLEHQVPASVGAAGLQVEDGLELLANVLERIDVSRPTAELWIRTKVVRGGRFVVAGRKRWFVDPKSLERKASEKVCRRAEDWRKNVIAYGPDVSPEVWDLFERAADHYRKMGQSFQPFPARPSPEELELFREKIRRQEEAEDRQWRDR